MSNENNALAMFDDLPLTDHLAREKTSDFKEYAKSIRFASKAEGWSSEKGIPVGNYALVDGDTYVDLGDELDVIPLTMLDKALDFGGQEPVVAFGKENPEYKRIADDAIEGGFESGCMVGPVILVYVRQLNEFCELFCMNKSLTSETERRLIPALPVTASQAEAHGLEEKNPTPMTLGSKYLAKSTRVKYPRHVPVFTKSEAVWDDPPSPEEFRGAILRFVDQTKVEKDDHDR